MCQIKECLMLPNLLVITVVAALALAPGTAGDDSSELGAGQALSAAPPTSGSLSVFITGPLATSAASSLTDAISYL